MIFGEVESVDLVITISLTEGAPPRGSFFAFKSFTLVFAGFADLLFSLGI